MKKKIVAMILVLACVTGIYAPENAWEAPVTVEASTQKGKKTPSIQKVYNAVKKAYGDDYIPSEKVSKKELKERYGISSKWYSAAIAEVPMISANADTLVIVKAKNAASFPILNELRRCSICSALTCKFFISIYSVIGPWQKNSHFKYSPRRGSSSLSSRRMISPARKYTYSPHRAEVMRPRLFQI